MKVIGLTGGTGSGKSVVSRYLKEMGAVIVDADLVSRQIVEVGKPAYEEIVAYFGKDILQEDGTIFRKKLGEIVFHDEEKLAFLNRCTHTYIVAEMKDQIEQAKTEGTASCIVLDAPLLFEVGLEKFCDAVWVVYADAEVRAQRVMDVMVSAMNLLWRALPTRNPGKNIRHWSDVVLDNSGDLAHLQEQLALAWKTLQE